MQKETKTYENTFRYDSPWTAGQRIKMFLWEYVWMFLCSWTPKPANNWRLFWLRMFGAKIIGKPFIHQRARIHIPWNISLHNRAAIGDRANLYSLAHIEIFEYATIAPEVFLCTGTHALDSPSMNLVTAPITIKANAFLGARVFVMPGVTINENAVIGACSLVIKDMPAFTICAGHPCKPIKERPSFAANDLTSTPSYI